MSFIQKFTKRDLGFSVLTGLIAGTIGWKVLEYLKVPQVHAVPWASLVLVVPILWILGVMLGYLLGQWLEFFNQFGKYAAIGFTNFAVNAGVLNILLARTGYVKGPGYSMINAISFVVAMLSSYVWNKYWAFKSNKNSQASGGEFIKFFIVTVVAFAVTLTVSSLVVNYVHPLLGMDAHQWANVATIIGAAFGLIFSFVGLRIAVFR